MYKAEKTTRAFTLITCWTPPVTITLLSLLYLLWPEFYLRFIIERSIREYQLVESLTLVLAFIATFVLLMATLELWKEQRAAAGTRSYSISAVYLSGAWIVGVCCLASFFFAGEEMNWGQTFVHWGVPEEQKPFEVNIHNHFAMPFTVMNLGDFFLFSFFIGMPILWRFRNHYGIPQTWAPAIPPWSVVFGLIVASSWEKVKFLYLFANPALGTDSSGLYKDFLQELNEHKEMFLAFLFLMYGLFVRSRIREMAGAIKKPVEHDRS